MVMMNMKVSSLTENKNKNNFNAGFAGGGWNYLKMKLELEFCGGMESLFNNEKQKQITLKIGDNESFKVKNLLAYIRDNLLTERIELFMLGETIRPGVLILINEVDWELEGGLEYNLKENDKILFISTLHGG